MKRYISILFCLPFFLLIFGVRDLKGQNLVGNTYAIYWDGSSECFATISQESGALAKINTIPNIKWIGNGGFESSATFNDDSSRYIFLGQDSNFTTHIYTLNYCGTLLYYPIVSGSEFTDITCMQYSSSTKKIYVLCWNASQDHEYFCTINPYNGSLTPISIVPGLKWINLGDNESTFMPDSNLFVAIEMDSLYNTHIYTIDILTGNLKYPAPTVRLVHNLEYDSTTKNIYGLYFISSIGYEFTTVNWRTGNLNILSTIPAMSGSLSYNNSTFNHDSNNYITEGFSSDNYIMYSLKSSNGNVLYSPFISTGPSEALADFKYGHAPYFNPTTNFNYTAICQGATVSFIASGGVKYLWSNGDTTSSFIDTPMVSTIYTVSVSNGYCIKKFNLSVGVFDSLNNTSLTGKNSICYGDTVALNATGGDSYLWSDGETTATIKVNPVSNVSYSVIISNGVCPSVTDSIKINVNPLPTLSVCCDTNIIQGKSVQLISSGGATYNWFPNYGLSCDNCSNPIANPYHSTTYYILAKSDSGCLINDSVMIAIRSIAICCDSIAIYGQNVPQTDKIDSTCGGIFIPTAFSPNGNCNNRLYVRGSCIASMDFIVFDRWGNKVFESQNQNKGWDGSNKGTALNMGTYIWSLDAALLDGTSIKKKGNVTLVR